MSIHAVGNDDYYYFIAASTGQATISTSFTHALGDLDLAVYDGDQAFLASSASTSDSESVTISVTDGLGYYVKVYGYSGATNPNYSLTINGPAIPPDIYEPNDTFETATNLGTVGNFNQFGLSIHAPNNDDYYQITAASDGPATVSIYFTHANGDLDMAMYDGGQNQIALSNGVSDSESFTVSLVAGATYYIRPYGYNGSTNADYSLSISGPPIPPDYYEPNDTLRQLPISARWAALRKAASRSTLPTTTTTIALPRSPTALRRSALRLPTHWVIWTSPYTTRTSH